MNSRSLSEANGGLEEVLSPRGDSGSAAERAPVVLPSVHGWMKGNNLVGLVVCMYSPPPGHTLAGIIALADYIIKNAIENPAPMPLVSAKRDQVQLAVKQGIFDIQIKSAA